MVQKTETRPELREYTRIQKSNGPAGSHPATRAVLRQPRAESDGRARQYARIERGREA
ncbi:hypothetical protein [Algicella marina]|uniref:Uncharacterized protein n=1 Tax=Algicella marina TaxID=2683284 RepID=A0A6P1T233_9RHOB|nr:hypothetical protein [Algicella marina]QHQ35850.1 hypothetical protein GO499_12035 [Algicella marina]